MGSSPWGRRELDMTERLSLPPSLPLDPPSPALIPLD